MPDLTTASDVDAFLASADKAAMRTNIGLGTADELSAPVFAADAGASDTYAATLSPAPSAYVTGAHYRFKANTANTGAATINFNSLGAITIVKAAGGITTALADNDIRAGQWVDVVYDGTNMQMQSTLGNAASGGGTWVLISTATISGSPATVDISLSGSYRKYLVEFEDFYSTGANYNLFMRTSSDGGSSFDSGASNYQWGRGALGSYSPVLSNGTAVDLLPLPGVGSTKGIVGTITFFDPLNTALKSRFHWELSRIVYNSSAIDLFLGTGYRDAAADVNALRFYFDAGNVGGGKIRLFGWSE